MAELRGQGKKDLAKTQTREVKKIEVDKHESHSCSGAGVEDVVKRKSTWNIRGTSTAPGFALLMKSLTARLKGQNTLHSCAQL